jgi:hypothetical protein
MLRSIDEFPEKRHHPAESKLPFHDRQGFASLAAGDPAPEADHNAGEGKVRELVKLLLA